MTTSLRVETTRGDLLESSHEVRCAVVARDGRLVAAAGDPDAPTWWRSAAKPFQALPLVQDGAADRFGLGAEELALACASHSSEPGHLAVVERFLAKVGVEESDLACGPHPPLSGAVHRGLLREGREPTPRWSNCSGKHAGMLALARHHGWPLAGYETAGHPVQRRILREVAAWTGVAEAEIRLAADGCAATSFGLPLRGMALAWARLGAETDPAVTRIREAMLADPWLVAGTGRPCTEIMTAWPGQVLAKVGADGVYGAALPTAGLGIAIKVTDGDLRVAPVALAAVLVQVAGWPGSGLPPLPRQALASWLELPVRNTRGAVTGTTCTRGSLVFPAGRGSDLA